MKDVTSIGAIHLERRGDSAVVSVEVEDGRWVDVITELVDGQFSHIIEARGIETIAKYAPVTLRSPAGGGQ